MDFLKPYGAVPSARQMAHYKIEKKAFFHFGVNTFTSLEWGDGTEKESFFNPVGCDCRQWIRAIKAAGFELAIITAKHHDGFCLWPSAHTEHSVKNSPYKDGQGDIIREFTDACREYGVKAGVYLSPWDRNAPYWGTAEYSKYYNLQLTELLTNYGRIDEVWWDGAGSKETPYDWGMWAHTVRNLQPDAVIFGSMGASAYVEMRWVGNEAGFAGDPCFGTIDEKYLAVETNHILNSGVPDGERYIIPEVDVSIRPGWFFHEEQEEEVKTPAKLVDIWFDSVGSNANLLLNFPPDRTGHIREKDVRSAIDAHRIIEKALSWNFALDAEVSCDVPCHEGYDAVNILNDYDASFFAPTESNAVITLKLPKKERINMFSLSEVIELGHRVRGFRVEAEVNGEWKVLYEGKCIGYKWAKHFVPVETDTVRLVIFDSKIVPLIRFFGLYYIDETIFAKRPDLASGRDLTKGASAKINYSDFEVEVEFGGIYPFNTVIFNGVGIWSYKIEAFDGANYQTVFEGKGPGKEQVVTLPETVRGSYKMRLTAEKKIYPEAINIRVYEL